MARGKLLQLLVRVLRRPLRNELCCVHLGRRLAHRIQHLALRRGAEDARREPARGRGRRPRAASQNSASHGRHDEQRVSASHSGAEGRLDDGRGLHRRQAAAGRAGRGPFERGSEVGAAAAPSRTGTMLTCAPRSGAAGLYSRRGSVKGGCGSFRLTAASTAAGVANPRHCSARRSTKPGVLSLVAPPPPPRNSAPTPRNTLKRSADAASSTKRVGRPGASCFLRASPTRAAKRAAGDPFDSKLCRKVVMDALPCVTVRHTLRRGRDSTRTSSTRSVESSMEGVMLLATY